MKKNGKLKWVIIVIAVIVVFGALAGGTDGGDDTKEAQTTSTEAKDTKDKKEKADKKDTKKEEVAENTAAESEEEKIPTEYKSALISAENYSDVMFMSKKGIYDQLVSEYGDKFSAEAAQYAVDHMTGWSYRCRKA